MHRARASTAAVGLRALTAAPRQSAETHFLRFPKTGVVRAVSCVPKILYALGESALRAEGVCGALAAPRNADSRVFVNRDILLRMMESRQCVSSVAQILCARMAEPLEWLFLVCTL